MIGLSFNFFGITIYTFWLFVDLGVLLSILYLVVYLKRFKIRRYVIHSVALSVVAFIFGFLGARILSVLEVGAPLRATYDFTIHAGFTFYGGLILVVPVLFMYLVLFKLPMAPTITILGISLALCYAIGRLGCFFSGDGCYGIITALPWGMSFPNGIIPTVHKVHPTPLYEALSSFIIFFSFHKAITKKTRESVQKIYNMHFFYLIILSFAISRFLVEFLRTNRIIYFFSLSQWVSLILILLCYCFFFVINKKKTDQQSLLTERRA